MEFFDIVDEQDQVVGTARRDEVHRRKLRHRAAHIFVFRPNGQLLIHLRSPHKEEFPSVWTSSASGHVSAGEDYFTAARRELQEELGIDSDLQRFGKFEACEDTSNEFTELFLTTSDAEIQFDPVEIVRIRWMETQAIADEMNSKPDHFSPAFRLLFRTWRQSEADSAP